MYNQLHISGDLLGVRRIFLIKLSRFIGCIFCVCSMQSWCWLQGDLFRAAAKQRNERVGSLTNDPNANVNGVYSRSGSMSYADGAPVTRAHSALLTAMTPIAVDVGSAPTTNAVPIVNGESHHDHANARRYALEQPDVEAVDTSVGDEHDTSSEQERSVRLHTISTVTHSLVRSHTV